MSLGLYQRLTAGTTGLAYLGDLTGAARGWRRKCGAVGGYLGGSLMLSQEDWTRAELTEFYNLNVGCRLVETVYGMGAWEGYVEEMRLIQDGAEMAISLKPAVFHNRVTAVYSVGPTRANTGWAENTSSSDEFGECNVIKTLGGAVAAAAVGERDKMLVEGGWPRSRITGGDAREGEERVKPDELRVAVAGYWETLLWRYMETTTTAAASSVLGTLIAASEFVVSKRIETNADSVSADADPVPRRIGDLVKEMVLLGDTSGHVWQGGVYGGRGFVYEEAPTDWTYQLMGEHLLDRAGGEAVLELVEPGFLLYNPAAATGWAKAGTATDWDDPRMRYVDTVEFMEGREGGELRMGYLGVEPGAEIIARRIQRGVQR